VADLVGQTLGRYEIVDLIGAGGMGEVYRARDPRLGRDVAIKVIHSSLSQNPTRLARFEQEARASGALNHPNLLAIHDVGHDQGLAYLVAELLHGETLRDKIESGSLTRRKAIDYAAQIADGLSAAHNHKIIHRDLKPDNVLVTRDGHVKILDFGLAKLTESDQQGSASTESPTESMVEAESVAGTPSYMSPEQLRGKPVDFRSDIFAFGVMLYEMITGRRPFVGDTSAEISASIFRDDPASLSDEEHPVPATLERVIFQCLEKSPEERFESAHDIAHVLRAISNAGNVTTAKPPKATIPSLFRGAAVFTVLIAVCAAIAAFIITGARNESEVGSGRDTRVRLTALPTEFLTDSYEREDWPNLIQILFSTDLAAAENIGFVEPLTVNSLLKSASSVRLGESSLKEFNVLRSSGIDFAITSTLHVGADIYRLNGNLVDLESGEIVFSATGDGSSEQELPMVVNTISRQILGYIQVYVFGLAQDENLRQLISVHEHDIEAVRAFMQATEYIYRDEPGGGQFLVRALEIEPDFIVARVWLISGLASAGNIQGAMEHYEYLLTLRNRANPVEQGMIDYVGAFLAGDLPSQARNLEFILSYSPGNFIIMVNLAWVHSMMGDCGAAVETLMPAVSARWSYPTMYVLLADCLIELGEIETARTRLQEAFDLAPSNDRVLAYLEGLEIRRGDIASANRMNLQLAKRTNSEPSPELAPQYHRIAEYCFDERNYVCAIALAQKSLFHSPPHFESQSLLADSLFETGNVSAALPAYLDALETNEDWTHGHLMAARLYRQIGQIEEASRHFRILLQLEPESPYASEAKQGVAKRDD
jgi:serine/threonine protein kinase/tetratricopeptide (TPR) repeat protein